MSKQAVDDSALAKFVLDEARLIDEQRWANWLALYATESVYWVPNGLDADPARDVSVIYDNRQRLEERIERIVSGLSFVQSPPSKTLHFVSGVEVLEGVSGSYHVRSNQMVAEVRHGRQRVIAGTCEHHLMTEGESILIAQKRFDLLNAGGPLADLTFII